MKHVRVTSSNIASIGYDATSGTLEVAFRGKDDKPGGLYSYRSVPAEVAATLRSSESVGAYFHKTIRGKFEFEKLPETEVRQAIAPDNWRKSAVEAFGSAQVRLYRQNGELGEVQIDGAVDLIRTIADNSLRAIATAYGYNPVTLATLAMVAFTRGGVQHLTYFDLMPCQCGRGAVETAEERCALCHEEHDREREEEGALATPPSLA